MNDLLVLVLGTLIALVCVIYWRVVAAILAVAVVGVFVVGVITVVRAVQGLGL